MSSADSSNIVKSISCYAATNINSIMRSVDKLAFNTFVIYSRAILTMVISLYSTRLILNALGSVDYGIFNLVAGVIAMLSFLNSAMSTSTQRYISYYQGKSDVEMQKKVFFNSLFLHIFIGLFLVVTLEIVGLFLFDGFLSVPTERVTSAKVIYHFMSATVFFTVLTVPFLGSLNAHENMIWVAIVNIVEAVLKLGIAVCLYFVVSDKLIVFGILTAGISIVTFILYSVYCFKKYKECVVRTTSGIDWSFIKELSSFAGWNLFGVLCALGRVQGLAILLNVFFGAVVNAAYGIANQIAAQSSFFSVTMLRVINPQIMRSEGEGNRSKMLLLSMVASKFGFYLLSFVAIPCIFEMPSILKFWLHDVPQYAVTFSSLILVAALLNQLTIGLQSAAQSVGKIKLYQSVVGGIILLNLPIAFLLLKYGYPAHSVLVSYIVFEFLACLLRLAFLKTIAGLSFKTYCHRVFFKELIPLITIISLCYFITSNYNFNFRFILTTGLSMLVYPIVIYFAGLCDDEKIVIDSFIKKIKVKIAGT